MVACFAISFVLIISDKVLRGQKTEGKSSAASNIIFAIAIVTNEIQEKRVTLNKSILRHSEART